MCGIAGFLGFTNGLEAHSVVTNMSDAIAYRGPDDHGIWVDMSAEIAFGHRRLSVLDLSPSGHQPMFSDSGRYVIVFNGEIYNHQKLREELENVDWIGHSDTETMLAAIERWGLEAALKKFIGMFAFALWDRQNCTLVLCRDRLGEKPLYYGWFGSSFLFGSEIKALRAHPLFVGTIDRNALALYMRYGVVPCPYSIYQGIHKLPPGKWLSISLNEKKSEMHTYWSVQEAVEAGVRNPFRGSDIEARDTLDQLLQESISGQMLSDVKLGAFLSGGLDSSTVVAHMQSQSKRPVSTFTVGFEESGFNEAEYAKAVAGYLGTDHTEMYVTSKQALTLIPQLPKIFDEPFADSSQIPTYLVSELARRNVTVSLSGDGGDELFAGYNRYLWLTKIWQRIGWVPSPLRAALSKMMTVLPPSIWDLAFSQLVIFLPPAQKYTNVGDKLHKLADVVAERSADEIYLALVSNWKRPFEVVLNSYDPSPTLSTSSTWRGPIDLESRMMYRDQITYMPDDILTKLDRASMAISLETRVPMLDHRIVEFAWSLPLSMKLRNGVGKWLLRQVLYKYVPQELMERPKMGFAIPLALWLRGPLKSWAESQLDTSRLKSEGYFRVDEIRRIWNEHLSGRRNWAALLWCVLMFQAWIEKQELK